MFITFDHTRIKVPFAGDGISGWNLMELPMALPFFLVGVSVNEEGGTMDKTFLVDSFGQLSELIKSQAAGSLKINFVNLVCPKQMLHSEGWEMHPLRKVYRAKEWDNPGQTCLVYQSVEGTMFFVESFTAGKIDDVYDLQEIYAV